MGHHHLHQAATALAQGRLPEAEVHARIANACARLAPLLQTGHQGQPAYPYRIDEPEAWRPQP